TQPVWTMHVNARSELWARLVDGSSVRIHKMYDKAAVRAMEREFERLLGIEDAKVLSPPPRSLRVNREGDAIRISRRPGLMVPFLLLLVIASASFPFWQAVWQLVSDPASLSAMMSEKWGKHSLGILIKYTAWLMPVILLVRLYVRPEQILIGPEGLTITGFGEPDPRSSGRLRIWSLPYRVVGIRKGMSLVFFEWICKYTAMGERLSNGIPYFDVALKMPEQNPPVFVARTSDVEVARFICQEIGRFYEIPWGEAENKKISELEYAQ
ncbi:MAG: hypothetical protein D6681_02720, partial [Calditrichaeota bacterium]